MCGAPVDHDAQVIWRQTTLAASVSGSSIELCQSGIEPSLPLCAIE